MICTKRRLNGEIERIKKILLDNSYPKNVINAQITKKIAVFHPLAIRLRKVPGVLEGPLD